MGMVQGALDVINCSIGHAASFEDLQPFLGGLLSCCRLYQVIDLSSMFYSVTVSRITSICLPFRESQPLRQDTKQLVIATSKKNVTIGCLVAPVGHDRSFLFRPLASLHLFDQILVTSHQPLTMRSTPSS